MEAKKQPSLPLGVIILEEHEKESIQNNEKMKTQVRTVTSLIALSSFLELWPLKPQISGI